LLAVPTGSGKTFAAFLSCIDGLFKQVFVRGAFVKRGTE
jgi:Lhr-like helicase